MVLDAVVVGLALPPTVLLCRCRSEESRGFGCRQRERGREGEGEQMAKVSGGPGQESYAVTFILICG